VLPFLGFSPTTTGGVVSLGPPDGITILAQPASRKQKAKSRMRKGDMRKIAKAIAENISGKNIIFFQRRQ